MKRRSCYLVRILFNPSLLILNPFILMHSSTEHVRRKLTPRQLLPLPWDNKKPVIRNNAPQLTAQERREI